MDLLTTLTDVDTNQHSEQRTAGPLRRTAGPGDGSTRRLLLSPPEIAGLARVKRPVVSMWRSRFSQGPHAFPAPVMAADGQERFDAQQVAEWLVGTKHGNNPEAHADLAAFATPENWNTADPHHVRCLESLIALRAADGRLVSDGALHERARAVDPGDEFLTREIEERDPSIDWAGFVDRFIDSAYSPVGAWSRLAERTTTPGATGAAGPLSSAATNWLAQLLIAMGDPERLILSDAPGGLSAGDIIAAAATRASEHRDVDVHVPPGDAARQARRLLVVHGLAHCMSAGPPQPSTPAVHVARLAGRDGARELAELEDLVIEMGDAQLALVLGPDALLCGSIAGAAERSRDEMLRSGRIRAIVRLTEGWIPTASRQTLALWVVGPAQHGASIAERFTLVGDLAGLDLTEGRVSDLVADILAGLGTPASARRHSFRYLWMARTAALMAAGSLTALGITAPTTRVNAPDPASLPALIDTTLLRLGEVAPEISLQSVAQGAAWSERKPLTIAQALSDREARVLSGVRLRAADTTASEGYRVLGRPELLGDAAAVRRIDRLRFFAEYPHASVTAPGDVVFLAGAAPRALVDHHGSSVVEYPARVLRLDHDTLSPEVVAADINAQPSKSPWRAWILRRVTAGQRAAIATAAAEISARRTAIEQQLESLNHLEELVIAAAAAGVIALGPAPTTHHTLHTTVEGAA